MGFTVIQDGKRRCIICGEILQLSEFSFYKYTTRQGKQSRRYSSKCKGCEKVLRKLRYSKNRHIELAVMAEYRKKNREVLNRKLCAYRAQNPEKIRLQRVISEQKRRADGYNSKRSDIKDVITQVLDDARVAGGYLDAYSGKIILNPTIDHIVPLSKGGTNDYENLCVTSRRNNISKHNKTFLRWFVRHAGSVPF